jgi:hypothetical protein
MDLTRGQVKIDLLIQKVADRMGKNWGEGHEKRQAPTLLGYNVNTLTEKL